VLRVLKCLPSFVEGLRKTYMTFSIASVWGRNGAQDPSITKQKKCTYVNTLNYLHTGMSHFLSIYWNPKIAFRVKRILPLDLDGGR